MSKVRIIAAVRRLDVTSTQDLLEHDPTLVDVADRRGFNLLHLACSTSPASLKMPASASVRMANVLLDRGLELESPVGRDACTALFFAVQRARNPLLVKALVSRGAKPANAPGGGLFAAAWWGDRDILKILLDAGATITMESRRARAHHASAIRTGSEHWSDRNTTLNRSKPGRRR
jgi:hypothetical protein